MGKDTSHPTRLLLSPVPALVTALPVTATPAQPPRQKLQIHPVCTGLALIPLKPLQASGRGSQQLQTTALICDSLPCQSAGSTAGAAQTDFYGHKGHVAPADGCE